MRRTIVLFLLSLMSFATNAQPSEEMASLERRMEGTIYVVPHRESADGVLTACGLEFGAMKRDFSTKMGAPVKIIGSFYFRLHAKAGLAYMLKLGVFDRSDGANGTAPSNAFVRAPNGNAPKKALRQEAENKGFALFVGALDKDVAAAYAGIVEKKQLVVGFNRQPGQQDVTFNLDLTVTDTEVMQDGNIVRKKSDEPTSQFMDCSAALMKKVTEVRK